MVGLAGRLRRLDRRLDIVGVKRIEREQFLGFGHRRRTFALLDQRHDFLELHHVGELRAEAGFAVFLEIRDLRRPQKLARLENVGSRRNSLHEHIHRQLVMTRLERLPPAIGEILSLLRQIDRHYDTSKRLSPRFSYTPLALYVLSMKWVAVERTPSKVDRSAATNCATS